MLRLKEKVMSCGCKDKSQAVQDKEQQELDNAAYGSKTWVSVLIFLFAATITMALLIPVIAPLILIMLWNRIVGRRSTNVQGTLFKIGKLFRTSKKRVDDDNEDEDDIEDIDDEDINPEDYELMDVDVIK